MKVDKDKFDALLGRLLQTPPQEGKTIKGYCNDSVSCRAPHDTDHAEFRGMRSRKWMNSRNKPLYPFIEVTPIAEVGA
jgi:hypothetical protein